MESQLVCKQVLPDLGEASPLDRAWSRSARFPCSRNGKLVRSRLVPSRHWFILARFSQRNMQPRPQGTRLRNMERQFDTRKGAWEEGGKVTSFRVFLPSFPWCTANSLNPSHQPQWIPRSDWVRVCVLRFSHSLRGRHLRGKRELGARGKRERTLPVLLPLPCSSRDDHVLAFFKRATSHYLLSFQNTGTCLHISWILKIMIQFWYLRPY